ncbi:MAG: carbon-nitrogen hydrolase family protein [Myxococcales bacterium]|nr:carbon-nitrogen hydrolase family protein [Myxococcales bacterium]
MAVEHPQHTTPSFRCAVVQLRSTEDMETNLRTVEELVTSARADGADVVALPENFAWLRINPETTTPRQTPDGTLLTRMRRLAQHCQVDLLLGGYPLEAPGSTKHFNAASWISKSGDILCTYRKLHLFGIDIPGTETQRESDHVQPGDEVCCVDTAFGKMGISICYDLRFPELYRKLVEMGSQYLYVPSAFTLTTGKDHWHTLLRARAIENQCYVIAPAQWGFHGGKRHSYGHSLIVDPWGIVVAEASDGVNYAMARIEPAHVQRVRTHLPALNDRRI